MAGVITAAAVSSIGGFLGAQEQAGAARDAANTSAAASRYAADIQKQMFERQVELQKPWYDVGVRALPQLEARVNAMPEAFTGKVDLTQDPGYQFRLSEGLKALDRTASARGGLLSGGALKAAAQYGQEMGSQEYGNAYSRALDIYNANVSREATGYNRLSNLAGVGQTSAGNLATQAGQFGTNVGNLSMTSAANQGNALLAGAAGRSSAYQGIGTNLGYALSNRNNWNNWNQLSNWWNSGSSGGAIGPSIGSNAYDTQDAYAARLNALEGFY